MKKTAGFTLVEILISLAVLITILFAGIELFSSIIRSNNKATVTNEVRQNSQLAIALFEREARKASDIQAVSADSFNFVYNDGTSNNQVVWFAPSAGNNGRIESEGIPVTNSDARTGVNVSSFSYSACNTTTIPYCNPAVLTLNMVFQQSISSPTRKDFVVSVPFTSTFTVRSKQQ